MPALCGLATLALVLSAAPGFAFSAPMPAQTTPVQHAQQRGHAQQLKQRKQARQLQRDQAKRTQATARKAYDDQPRLQQRMKSNARVRRKQSRDNDRDLDRRIDKAERPQPTHTAPVPASSSRR